MGELEIVLNRAGVRSVLRGSGVSADLEARGRRVAVAAGPGHEVESSVGPHRAHVSVRTATFAAMLAEAKTRALTRAIEAAR